MLNSITPAQNQQINFQSSLAGRAINRTITWDKAIELTKNKSNGKKTEWQSAIKEFKSAKYNRFYILSDIAKKLGINFDGNVSTLIESIFKAFENGKITEEQCFGRIKKINDANYRYNSAEADLNNIRAKNQIEYVSILQRFIDAMNAGLKKA